MDTVASKHMVQGFETGVRNARGIQLRGVGGEQEHRLARKYRDFAIEVGFEYPFVASILERIAKTYEQEGAWWDSEQNAAERLGN